MKRLILFIGLLVPASSYSMNNANNDMTAKQYYSAYQQQKENKPLSTAPRYILASSYPREYSQRNSLLGKTEEFVEVYAVKPQLFFDNTFFHRVIHTQGTDHYHMQEKENGNRLNLFGITNLAALLGIILLSPLVNKK
ncbi:hypothetical protein HYX58_01595 [Candidatus Dependentiae bacterium]|nr:hypothetical protein [Candidatus Dependentiae bacterium]